MQCPACNHEAAVSDFGDPLRCPECGMPYESAVLSKAREEAAKDPRADVRSRSGVAPSNVGSAASIKASNSFWLYILVFGVVALAYGLAYSFFGNGGADKSKADDCTTTVAYRAAMNIVAKNLKAPATAKFPGDWEESVSVEKAGICKFRVVGYVDSQNAFGAMIRTHYTLNVERMSDGKQWEGTAFTTF